MSRTSRTDRRRSAVGLVARREITIRLGARSFYVISGLMVVGIVALGIVARVTDDESTSTWDIGMVSPDASGESQPPAVGEALGDLGSTIDVEVTVTPFVDIDGARSALEDGDLDAVVDIESRRLLFDETVDDLIVGVVQHAWTTTETHRRLVDAGLNADEVDEALAVTPLDVASVGDATESEVGLVAGSLAAILLFISVQMFGTYVLTGVVEEKSTAVVEVLLVRTRPADLLAGKVIGIGAVALGQFLVLIAAGMTALAISGASAPGSVWSALPATVLWFLGGFTMYSTLFALAGSLVSRQEDAQAAAAPVSVLLIAAYLLISILGFEPDSTASAALSMMPFVAPMLMPIRMASGAASVVEILVALALLAATTWLVWRVASRIYEQVLLRRGSRISWREAAKLLRP